MWDTFYCPPNDYRQEGIYSLLETNWSSPPSSIYTYNRPPVNALMGFAITLVSSYHHLSNTAVHYQISGRQITRHWTKSLDAVKPRRFASVDSRTSDE